MYFNKDTAIHPIIVLVYSVYAISEVHLSYGHPQGHLIIPDRVQFNQFFESINAQFVSNLSSGFNTICRQKGIQFKPNELEEEYMICIEPHMEKLWSSRVVSLTTSVDKQRFQGIIMASGTGGPITFTYDTKVWLKGIIQPTCDFAIGYYNCRTPVKGQTIGPCFDRDAADIFTYIDLALKSLCKDDGANIISFVESGWECLGSYSNGVTNCINSKIELFEIAKKFEPTPGFCAGREVHRCLYDSVNACPNKNTVAIFHSTFSDLDNWTKTLCQSENTGGISDAPKCCCQSLSQVFLILLLVLPVLLHSVNLAYFCC